MQDEMVSFTTLTEEGNFGYTYNAKRGEITKRNCDTDTFIDEVSDSDVELAKRVLDEVKKVYDDVLSKAQENSILQRYE